MRSWRGETDIAVHSMKDMPAMMPEGLTIGAIPEREDLRDALISRGFRRLRQDADKARASGTSSLRRQSQLLHYASGPGHDPIRGNVETRISKMETEGLDGVVLAAAGMKRIKFEDRMTEYFDPDVHASRHRPGGSGHRNSGRRPGEPRELIAFSEPPKNPNRCHRRTRLPAQAARRVPGSHRRLGAGSMEIPYDLIGMVADVDGSRSFREPWKARWIRPRRMGTQLAERFLDQGARDILEKLLENVL